MINRKKKIVAIALLLAVALIGILLYIWEAQLVYTDPELNLGMWFYETGSDDEEDFDQDGLINAEERQYGTDIHNIDTDGDGLTDYYEIKESKTNALRPDSDYDGLNDRAELFAGLDPNNKMTDGKTADNRRTFDVVRSNTRVKLTVSGNANVYDVYAGTFNTAGLKNTPGLVCDVYEFYLETPFNYAELVFNYTDRELKTLGFDENNLSIFQLTNDGEFKAVDSIVDTEKNTVTAKLRHFSKYTLGDQAVINADMGVQVMLLIDNSGSMYPEELCSTSEENDVDFKRIDMAKELIDYAGDSIQFGAAKFTATYTLLSELGTDSKKIKAQLDEIRTKEENFNGTYIANSIGDALSQFKEKDYANKKYIVLLTDGETTEGGFWDFTFYDEDDAIKDCINKHVSVIAVGLGNSVDTDYLQKIADKTGGVYLHASNADALKSIYKVIYSQLNYAFVDIDEDGDNDAVTVADSGFDPKCHGFSFTNFSVIYEGSATGGLCYGMAAFAQSFYRNKVRVSEKSYEAKLGGLLGGRTNTTVASYDLSDTGVLAVANLHDYNNKWLMACDKLEKDIPVKDRYYWEDGKLKFTDDYRQRIEQIGCKYIKTDMLSRSKAKWGNKTFKYYESIFFDLDAYLAASGEKDPEMEFPLAIYWYYCRQGANIPKAEERNLYDGTDANTMIVNVAKGIPPIFLDRSDWHARNITKVLRDIENPRKYYLEAYDNNYVDSLSYYTMEIVDISLLDKIEIANWDENYHCKLYNTEGKSITASFAILH